jgi:hypothetical protein
VLQAQSHLETLTYGGASIDLLPFYAAPTLAPYYTAPSGFTALEIDIVLRLLTPRLNNQQSHALWQHIRFLPPAVSDEPANASLSFVDLYPADLLKPSVLELQLMQSHSLQLTRRLNRKLVPCPHLFYAVSAYVLGQTPRLRYLALEPYELDEYFAEMLKVGLCSSDLYFCFAYVLFLLPPSCTQTNRTISALSVLRPAGASQSQQKLLQGPSTGLLSVLRHSTSIQTLNLNFCPPVEKR